MIALDILRWVTVMALRGYTWAGDNVLDSPASPADLIIEEDRAPFISVYVDDADIDLDAANSLLEGQTTVQLLLECAIGESIRVQNNVDDKAPDLVTRLGRTDDALEANIGFLAWQAIMALTHSGNPWAELWRELAPVRTAIQVRRGGYGQHERDEPSVRYASRVVRITVEVLHSPPRGDSFEEGSTWAKFMTMAAAEAVLAPLAAVIAENLHTDAPVPSWRLAQRQMTLTRRAIEAIGIAPVIVGDDELEPPGLTRTTFHNETPGQTDLQVEEEP